MQYDHPALRAPLMYRPAQVIAASEAETAVSSQPTARYAAAKQQPKPG